MRSQGRKTQCSGSGCQPGSFLLPSLSFAEYAVVPFDPGCSPLPWAALKGVAVTCILFLMLVICWSSQLATTLTNMGPVAKVSFLLVIMGAVWWCRARAKAT